MFDSNWTWRRITHLWGVYVCCCDIYSHCEFRYCIRSHSIQFYPKRLCAHTAQTIEEEEEEKKYSVVQLKDGRNRIELISSCGKLLALHGNVLNFMWKCNSIDETKVKKKKLHKKCCAWEVRVWIEKMATQKPGEWASCILSRFEEQVNRIIPNFSSIYKNTKKEKNGKSRVHFAASKHR